MKVERAVFVPELDRLAAGEPCDRLYLGSELCPLRLPTAQELGEALEEAARRGAGFTLVTPFLDERDLAGVTALVRSLPPGGGVETVVNDFGLLEELAGAGWGGTLVLGRLLTRQRRGPGFQFFGEATPDARTALRGSALDAPRFAEWLAATFGVRRFEIDDLVQGVTVGPLPEGVRLSLYRPWLLVTATRSCPWVFGQGAARGEPGCGRPCRGRTLRLEPAEGGRELVLGGCAQFLEHRDGERELPPGVDRVVWQPGVPA